MLLSDYDPILIPFIPDELDDALAARACAQLGTHPQFAAVVRPERPFFQPTHLCFPLVGVIYLLTSPLDTWEIVIFLDKRPVCQSFAAVRLPCAIMSVRDAVATLRLHVEMVESHRLWVKGGQTVLGDLVVHHRCILSVRLEHEDCKYFPSEDEGGSSPPNRRDEADEASGSDGRPGTSLPNQAGRTDPTIDDTSGNRQGHATRGHTGARGGLWGRLLVLAQCFTDGQSFQAMPSQAGIVIGPQLQADVTRFPAADQWREKKWKPSSFDFYGTGLGADTPRFFSSIGDAASIMLLSRQVSEMRLCGAIFMSFSRIPVTRGAVVLPIQQDADEICDVASGSSDQHSTDEAYFTVPAFPSACDDYHITAPWGTDPLVQSDLCTLLDENRGDKLWKLCGDLADFLSGIQCHYPSRNDFPLLGSHGNTSGQILCLQGLVLEGNEYSRHHACHLECGLEYEMLETLLEGHAIQHLDRDVVSAESLHEHTRAALRMTPEWETAAPFSRVVLYTDGSFKPGVAAVSYAVVALVEVDEQWHFAGHFARAIPATQLGDAVGISAHTAELCGMIHARLINACTDRTPCLIRYDCQSAAQTMQFANAVGAPLDRAASWLDAVCLTLGISTDWEYVAGHHGEPWNEFADHLAKYQLQKWAIEHKAEPDIIAGILHEGWAPWLWISIASRHSPSSWPTPCADGSFVNDAPSMCASDAPLIQHQQAPQAKGSFCFRIATYNTLSLRVPGQIECLDEHFGKECSILGLQETRQEQAGIEHGNRFLRFSSAACHGQGGCQIWLSKFRSPGTDVNRQPLCWKVDSFVIHHSDPRCLAISGKAGDTLFGIVSAHARVSNSEDECLRAFWRQLTAIVGKLPERSIKIVMVDANATFNAERWVEEYYPPVENNAYLLLQMAAQTSTALSDLWDAHGQEVKTWCSPTGYSKALDFIMVPRSMAQHMTTIGADHSLVDMFAGIDHRPLLVDMAFSLQVHVAGSSRRRFDVNAMNTTQGQAKLSRIFQNAPEVGWNVHASDHWEVLKAYLVQECSQDFPARLKSPRKTYISDELWDMIANLRQLRSELRYRHQHVRRFSLYQVFHAWALQCEQCQRYGALLDASPCKARATKQDHAIAGLWSQIAIIKRDIKLKMRDCQAEQARQAFIRAREDGPGAVASLMVTLTRSGRRRRPPATLPPIRGNDGATLTDQAAVFKVLGEHFARAERATSVSPQQLLQMYQQPPVQTGGVIDGADIPNVQDLCQRDFDPQRTQLLLRGETPIDFLRSFICPIPKPGKDATTAAGWRSIALQEIPHKAVSSMIRKYLVKALDRAANPLQLGGRPKGPIGVPSLHALAHVRRARRMKCSSGVLYIDGVQAFTPFCVNLSLA